MLVSPTALRERCEDQRELAVDLSVSSCGRRVHVQHTIPDLVVEVLAEPPTPLEQRLELGRLRVAHERRHALKGTADLAMPIGIAPHSSPVPLSAVRRPVIRRSAPISPTCPTACASCDPIAGFQVGQQVELAGVVCPVAGSARRNRRRPGPNTLRLLWV